MKKIHKVSYAEIFSTHFATEKIDANLKNMEIDEKLFLLDNIIDYLYYNFKNLREHHNVYAEATKQKMPKVPLKRKLPYEQ